jgi:hypothetical protein
VLPPPLAIRALIRPDVLQRLALIAQLVTESAACAEILLSSICAKVQLENRAVTSETCSWFYCLSVIVFRIL